MIRVHSQPEPDDFDERVRQPGLSALSENPPRMPDYWGRCAEKLWDVYNGICAYVCIFIPKVTGARSVDHLFPKSKRQDLAYEWSNYRLACSLMNSRKRDFDDVLDPFEIENGWFILELSFLQVLPHPDLDEEGREKVQATIDRLKLNDKDCIEARAMYYDVYVSGDLSFGLLERWSPFVASELKRQRIVP